MRRWKTLIPFLVIAGSPGCRDEMLNEPKRGVAPESRASLVVNPVTPANGGGVTAQIIPIDIQATFKDNVHVSGDLACYGDYGAQRIRSFRFSTAINAVVPSTYDAAGQCAVAGNQIIHPDVKVGFSENPIYVFDAAAATTKQLEPQRTAARYDPAIGGNTVAFFDYFFTAPQVYTSTDLRVVDLGSPDQSQVLSSTGGVEVLPNVSPDGNMIVWESVAPDGYSDVKKVVRSSGVWGAPQGVAATPSCSEERPDTDGQYIVWTQACSDDNDNEIYFQPAAGGTVTKIVLSGDDSDPRIDGGVIVFVHDAPDFSSHEVMVYTIASNTLLRVTNTPSVRKVRPDVSVVSGGNIRVVWVTLTDGDNVVQGTTFTPTGGPVGNPTFTFGGFGGSLKAPPAVNNSNAGATVPVHFSLGGDRGLSIFAPGSPSSVEVDCTTFAVRGSSEPAIGQGSNPLGYSFATDTYTFKWSTASSWGKTCRKFVMEFAGGPQVYLIFQFK